MRQKFSKKSRLSSLLNKICLKIIKIPMRIISKCRKIMKCCVLIDLDRPNRSKTIKNRKIHPGELSEFFPFFFAKFYFSHFFQVFSSSPWRDFRYFARSPMQSTLLLVIKGIPIDFHFWCKASDKLELKKYLFIFVSKKNLAEHYLL